MRETNSGDLIGCEPQKLCADCVAIGILSLLAGMAADDGDSRGSVVSLVPATRTGTPGTTGEAVFEVAEMEANDHQPRAPASSMTVVAEKVM